MVTCESLTHFGSPCHERQSTSRQTIGVDCSRVADPITMSWRTLAGLSGCGRRQADMLTEEWSPCSGRAWAGWPISQRNSARSGTRGGVQHHAALFAKRGDVDEL